MRAAAAVLFLACCGCIAGQQRGDVATIEQYEKILKREPGNLQAAALLGDALVLAGRYGEAVQVLKPLAQAHPDNLDVAFLLGEALIEGGEPRGGLPLIEHVAKVRHDADAWMLTGITQLRLGETAPAESSFQTALRINPRLPGLHTLDGIAKARLGREEEAKAAYRSALQSEPKDFEANLRLGAVLRHQGDLEHARPYLQRAVKLNGDSVLARYQLAELDRAAGRDREAAAGLEAVVRRAPNALQVHVRLAALYYRLQRPEDGARERQMVDRLLADPQSQDHQLEADPSIPTDRPEISGRSPSP